MHLKIMSVLPACSATTVTFDFPARGSQPACKFYWYEVRRPPERLRNMVNGQLSSGGSFIVGDRAKVDAFHKTALAHGGSDEGAPGLRAHYHPNYYGAYVRDPDGNKIQAVCHRSQK